MSEPVFTQGDYCGMKTWTLRVVNIRPNAETRERGPRWHTYSLGYAYILPDGCDHTVTAETRAKAATIAIREHREHYQGGGA